MLKIRRPLGRLIFNMGIAIPGKTVFLIETAPWVPTCAGGIRVSFMQPHLFQIDVKMARMANISNRLICVKFISMLSMYVQFGTHRHFHWRIIVVLTQNPTVLMFVDITSTPQTLAEICRNRGVCWGFRAVATRGKKSGVYAITQLHLVRSTFHMFSFYGISNYLLFIIWLSIIWHRFLAGFAPGWPSYKLTLPDLTTKLYIIRRYFCCFKLLLAHWGGMMHLCVY